MDKQILKIDCLSDKSIVIDCGANVGYITRLYEKTGATVYAIEPNPFAFKKLQEEFQDCPKVHCINKAVHTLKGPMKLYHHENSNEDELKWSQGSSLMESKVNITTEKFTLVDILDLGSFIQKLNCRIDVIKMDIEGAEVKVIQKLINSGVIDQIDYMIVETHEKKIPEIREGLKRLKDCIAEKNLNHINLNWI